MRKLYDKNDELRNEFKDTFSGIHASEDLKARTLAQILENTQPQSETVKSSPLSAKGKWRIALPVTALVCAALVLGVLSGTPKPSYLTQLENGVFCEEVKLKDGELHFVTNRIAISITPNAGGIAIGQKPDEISATLEDVAEILEEKENAVGAQFIYKKVPVIELPNIGEKNWSYIGEQKIYISVLDTVDTRYQAVFEKDGQVYEVIGVGVWQKEFIDYLYQIVKKLK